MRRVRSIPGPPSKPDGRVQLDLVPQLSWGAAYPPGWPLEGSRPLIPSPSPPPAPQQQMAVEEALPCGEPGGSAPRTAPPEQGFGTADSATRAPAGAGLRGEPERPARTRTHTHTHTHSPRPAYLPPGPRSLHRASRCSPPRVPRAAGVSRRQAEGGTDHSSHKQCGQRAAAAAEAATPPTSPRQALQERLQLPPWNGAARHVGKWDVKGAAAAAAAAPPQGNLQPLLPPPAASAALGQKKSSHGTAAACRPGSSLEVNEIRQGGGGQY